MLFNAALKQKVLHGYKIQKTKKSSDLSVEGRIKGNFSEV